MEIKTKYYSFFSILTGISRGLHAFIYIQFIFINLCTAPSFWQNLSTSSCAKTVHLVFHIVNVCVGGKKENKDAAFPDMEVNSMGIELSQLQFFNCQIKT